MSEEDHDVSGAVLPRTLSVDPLLLDLFHRDVWVGGKWIGLHPREFEVVWRLAEAKGHPVSKARLLRDVWRLQYQPQGNRLEVTISRIRAKLHVVRQSSLIITEPSGGYCLKNPNARSDTETLDSYLRLANVASDKDTVGEHHGISDQR